MHSIFLSVAFLFLLSLLEPQLLFAQSTPGSEDFFKTYQEGCLTGVKEGRKVTGCELLDVLRYGDRSIGINTLNSEAKLLFSHDPKNPDAPQFGTIVILNKSGKLFFSDILSGRFKNNGKVYNGPGDNQYLTFESESAIDLGRHSLLVEYSPKDKSLRAIAFSVNKVQGHKGGSFGKPGYITALGFESPISVKDTNPPPIAPGKIVGVNPPEGTFECAWNITSNGCEVNPLASQCKQGFTNDCSARASEASCLGPTKSCIPEGTNPPGGTNPLDLQIINPLNAGTIPDILNAVSGFLYALALAFVTIMVLWGGFQILTAAGSPGQIDKGKQTLLWAVIGTVVILIAGGIAGIIKDILGGPA